jgi:hypothetical protein
MAKGRGEGRQFRTLFLTVIALTAFAANSVLCRMGLGSGAIDAGSFTSLRLGTGALTLFVLLLLSAPGRAFSLQGSWLSAAMLFPMR